MKKLLSSIIIISVLMVALFTGCEPTAPADKLVSQITIDGEIPTLMYAGDSFSVEKLFLVSPGDATNKELSITFDKEGLLKLEGTTITTVGSAGKVKVIATAKDASAIKVESHEINVMGSQSAPKPIQEIIAYNTLPTALDSTETIQDITSHFAAYPADSDNTELTISFTPDGILENTGGVITVSSSFASPAQEVTVKATSVADPTIFIEKNINVTYTVSNLVTAITLKPSFPMEFYTDTLAVDLAEYIIVTPMNADDISYSLTLNENPSGILTLSGTTLTKGTGPGTATITVTANDAGGATTTSKTITTYNISTPNLIEVITITGSLPDDLYQGETINMAGIYTITPDDATDKTVTITTDPAGILSLSGSTLSIADTTTTDTTCKIVITANDLSQKSVESKVINIYPTTERPVVITVGGIQYQQLRAYELLDISEVNLDSVWGKDRNPNFATIVDDIDEDKALQLEFLATPNPWNIIRFDATEGPEGAKTNLPVDYVEVTFKMSNASPSFYFEMGFESYTGPMIKSNYGGTWGAGWCNGINSTPITITANTYHKVGMKHLTVANTTHRSFERGPFEESVWDGGPNFQDGNVDLYFGTDNGNSQASNVTIDSVILYKQVN